MTKIMVSNEFDVDANALWSAVCEFNNMEKYLPSMITSCVVEGKGQGAKRICGTENGDIKETLKLLDDENMLMEYTIDNEDAPLPLEKYTGRAEIERISNGKVKFSWSGEFKAKGMTEEEVSQILKGAYGDIMKNIVDSVNSNN